MISVLIPVFQTNVEQLVLELQRQLLDVNQGGEIILSDVSPNQSAISHVGAGEIKTHYYHHQEKLSRSENRNFLASKASFPFLLFIDADAIVINKSFIQTYFDHLDPHIVLCGGTAYAPEPPGQRELILRWKYGQQREAISARERNREEHRNFSSFNFLIPARIFSQYPFSTRFNRYGHEDTYFGFELKQHEIPIVHIDNQLIHGGLDEIDLFLEKTREGIQALAVLSQETDMPEEFLQSIRLWKTYSKMSKYGFLGAFERFYSPFAKMIEANLRSGHPDIRLFDLYKLAYLSKIKG